MPHLWVFLAKFQHLKKYISPGYGLWAISIECLQLSSLVQVQSLWRRDQQTHSHCSFLLSNGSTGDTAAQIRLPTGKEMALRYVGCQFSLVCLLCLCLLGMWWGNKNQIFGWFCIRGKLSNSHHKMFGLHGPGRIVLIYNPSISWTIFTPSRQSICPPCLNAPLKN